MFLFLFMLYILFSIKKKEIIVSFVFLSSTIDL